MLVLGFAYFFFSQVSGNLDLLENIYIFLYGDEWNLEKERAALAKLTVNSIWEEKRDRLNEWEYVS